MELLRAKVDETASEAWKRLELHNKNQKMSKKNLKERKKRQAADTELLALLDISTAATYLFFLQIRCLKMAEMFANIMGRCFLGTNIPLDPFLAASLPPVLLHGQKNAYKFLRFKVLV